MATSVTSVLAGLTTRVAIRLGAAGLSLAVLQQAVGGGAASLITTPLRVIASPIMLPLRLLMFPIVAPLSVVSWPLRHPFQMALLTGTAYGSSKYADRVLAAFAQ